MRKLLRAERKALAGRMLCRPGLEGRNDLEGHNHSLVYLALTVYLLYSCSGFQL